MAHSSAAAARRRRAAGPAPSLTGPASDVHPVLRRTTAPPAALDLLAQARTGLEEATVLETPNERYATAHLAALRTAAAVLAARGRPETTPRARARIRSAWEVLPEIAPELSDWSALFAAGARRRARAEAGIQGAANRRDADDLIRDVAMFLRLVERMLVLQPVLPQPRPDADRPETDRPDTDRPAADRPGADHPSADRPGLSGPGSDGPGSDRPGGGRAGDGRAGHHLPDVG
ncbi:MULTISPECIES: SAV_6107 family HEPN domain-containing protein [unclassified Streptomyces]|uniref:SAV_6107 family HEPN domain-containing protein n=1 Tax=unclassified Streptomyces TaxID=2593676 RepID=UPI002441B060|nr:SAV_6107 family HEPN domain-containing protein [Streptomyces sp. DH41]MDG9725370.1 SAV_6107 family HEPN domain-containing protein [Streptomyces sp. DH41]